MKDITIKFYEGKFCLGDIVEVEINTNPSHMSFLGYLYSISPSKIGIAKKKKFINSLIVGDYYDIEEIDMHKITKLRKYKKI